ncbi:hypothetical protein [Agrobacterium tumefaciens]|uniref:hypothetical protein n=1 Tax=Agrobacterium tumefaciens TaxID=358 RepID=UPI003B9E5F3A
MNPSLKKNVEYLRSLPGFKEDADGNGYKFLTPSGRMSLRGAGLFDEITEVGEYGTLNATKLVKIVEKGHTPVLLKVKDLFPNISKREVDHKYAKMLTKDRLAVPLIGIVNQAGAMDIVDGTHRLWRLWKLRQEDAEVFCLKHTVINVVRVTYRVEVGGLWLPFDKTKMRLASTM